MIGLDRAWQRDERAWRLGGLAGACEGLHAATTFVCLLGLMLTSSFSSNGES